MKLYCSGKGEDSINVHILFPEFDLLNEEYINYSLTTYHKYFTKGIVESTKHIIVAFVNNQPRKIKCY